MHCGIQSPLDLRAGIIAGKIKYVVHQHFLKKITTPVVMCHSPSPLVLFLSSYLLGWSIKLEESTIAALTIWRKKKTKKKHFNQYCMRNLTLLPSQLSCTLFHVPDEVFCLFLIPFAERQASAR